MKTLTLAGLLFGASLLALSAGWHEPERAPGPQTVMVPAGAYAYRPSGEFRQGRRVVDAPVETRVAERSFEIMTYPVSRADYALCVAEGVCAASVGPGDRPLAQVDVSFRDAETYASWLSERTGQAWRLPTGDEWSRAAAERAIDEAVAAGAEDDPSVRWLAVYGQSAGRRGEADLRHYPQGAFGTNSLGVADIGANVWEWTASCFVTGELDAQGRIVAQTDYCGVRVAEGRHRAFVIDFVRDAKRGGCAAGLPPDYLGFRLVRG
jgi:formylglycine-generating enzyme required for sulfatase activity